MSECPYEVGDKFRFIPGCCVENTNGFGEVLRVEVTGTVVSIHEEHRWYRACYDTPQGVQHETFKF